MEKVCRVCCQINSLKSIFSENNEYSLAYKIMTCASVNILKEDFLPTNICEPCVQNLETAYSFKLKCEQTDKFLRALISNNEIDFSSLSCETILQKHLYFLNNTVVKSENEHSYALSQEVSAKKSKNIENKVHKKLDVKNIDWESRSNSNSSFTCDTELKPKLETETGDMYITEKCFDDKFTNVNITEMCSVEIYDKDEIKKEVSQKTTPNPKPKQKRKSKLKDKTVPEKNECDICGKILNSKRTLIGHKRIHTGEKPYQCTTCSKQFTHRTALTFHIKRHAGEKYQCEECGKDYTRKSTLTQHIKLVHSNKIVDQNGVVHSVHLKAFECSLCEKKFATTQHLNSHVKVHTGERNYVCDLCGKQFTHSSTLSAHHRVKHKGEKKYVCDICGKRFPHMCGLKCHYKAHSGVKDVGCTQCGQFFASKSQLKDHEKRAHLLKKDYHCTECGKPFVTNKELKRHIFSFHQKERPFVCKFCNRKFSFVGNLNYHIKKRHNNSN